MASKKPTLYNGNPCLKAAGVETEFTEENISEYLKCSADPIYFIKNYVKIVHVDKGIVPFALHSYQERLVQSYHDNRKVVALAPRQYGKCCVKTTLLNIRNKKTGEIMSITMEDFHEMCKL